VSSPFLESAIVPRPVVNKYTQNPVGFAGQVNPEQESGSHASLSIS
jgi:hypothetical protein